MPDTRTSSVILDEETRCRTTSASGAPPISPPRSAPRGVRPRGGRAHLERIERVNPSVNAIVTLTAERAMAEAAAADERLASGAEVGPLHGLPVAHKDLVATAGIRTTYGSPIFADNVPDQDDLVVQRLRAAGAITIGKTNTPELGARLAHLQPRVRDDAQPVRPDEVGGRQQRRRCGGARDAA